MAAPRLNLFRDVEGEAAEAREVILQRADYPGQHAEAIVKFSARLYDLRLKDFDSAEIIEKNADNPLLGLAEPTG